VGDDFTLVIYEGRKLASGVVQTGFQKLLLKVGENIDKNLFGVSASAHFFVLLR
jgi:hypothetical protein